MHILALVLRFVFHLAAGEINAEMLIIESLCHINNYPWKIDRAPCRLFVYCIEVHTIRVVFSLERCLFAAAKNKPELFYSPGEYTWLGGSACRHGGSGSVQHLSVVPRWWCVDAFLCVASTIFEPIIAGKFKKLINSFLRLPFISRRGRGVPWPTGHKGVKVGLGKNVK